MGKLAKLVVCFYVRWATMQVECGIFVDVGVAFGAIQIKGHKIVKVSKILAICAIVLCCCIWISSLVRMEFLKSLWDSSGGYGVLWGGG